MAAKKTKTKTSAASARKKTAPKKTAAKKAPAKKPATAKKAPAKKAASAKKAPVRKPAAKKAAPKPRQAAPATTAAKAAGNAASLSAGNNSGGKRKALTAKEVRFFHQLLLELRDRVTDEITFLTGDNLNRSQRDASGDLSNYGLHMADQGTDNADREFALSLVSTEQDIIYEIEEAIRRIDNGTYGVCEHSGDPIEKERLKVLPHARYCVSVQSEFEKGRVRHRPSGAGIQLDS